MAGLLHELWQMHSHTNRLINETSPYLLQHAHNPVDWYPWGEEALQRSQRENKPILVSIGYAACHWCHVMERESFENEDTAAFMNEHFVNIKIDREERPDLDHIYMDAVQAMTGSGGWPLNVFLTPDCKPFYGGTYFPPVRAYNRASWLETLKAVSDAFQNKRDEINSQAENLTEHLLQSNFFGQQEAGADQVSWKSIQESFEQVMKTADTEWGGFGRAPKFPQSFTIQFLLHYHYVNHIRKPMPGQNLPDDEGRALKQALLSLDKMIEGGIYDQIGGGFARYSTDTEWLAPHFEKMLYDNALLVSVICEAYQLTQDKKYLQVIEDTISFVKREMLHPGAGFYSALDADSEGEEGKYYVWNKAEVEDLLGETAGLFCDYFDITEKGNWEGKNIPRVKKALETFAKEKSVDVNEAGKIIDKGKELLLAARSKRIRPLLDDKIILGWNALMNTALSKACAATGRADYKELAVANMNFLLEKFEDRSSGGFFHTWKNDKARFPAFLDDYASLIQALISLYEITADTSWLKRSKSVTEFVLEHFSESATGFFYYTPIGQNDVIIRKKELYDGAVPSGNSLMAGNLYRLSLYFDDSGWRARAWSMISTVGRVLDRYPTSFGFWNVVRLEMMAGVVELAVLGRERLEETHRDLLKQFLPQRVLMVSDVENEEFALLAQKPALSTPAIYVCENFKCSAPVESVTHVLSLINRA